MGEDDQSSSRSEASVKEKSKSKSPEAEELVGGGGGGGGGAPASSASKLEKIALYIAIVALVLCLIALALSCYLTVLWWYWNLVLTVPALAIALVALFFAPLCPKKKMPLFQPGHHEISLGFGALGIILGLAGLIWCCVEIGWAHTNQGGPSLDVGGKKGLRIRRAEGAFGGLSFEAGFMCHGQAFDWSYRSKALVMEHDCKVKNAKFLKDLAKSAKGAAEGAANAMLGAAGKLPRRRRSGDCCTDGGWPSYKGVDSYSDSPVYKTHNVIVQYNSRSYIPKPSAALTLAQTAHDAACVAFDKDLKEFYKAREKCDKALKKMKPKCEKSEDGYEYKFTKEDNDGWTKVDEDCKSEKFGRMMRESKYRKAGARPGPSNGGGGPGDSDGDGSGLPPGNHHNDEAAKKLKKWKKEMEKKMKNGKLPSMLGGDLMG